LESRCQTLLTFAPSFPTRPDLYDPTPCGAEYLSWGCPKKPLRRLSSGSPLPGAFHERTRFRLPSGGEGQPSSVFRPRGFSPPRRFPPPSDVAPDLAGLHSTVPTLRAYFSALPTLGFTTFQRTPPPPDPCESCSRLVLVPVMLSRPSKPSPRTQLRWPASRRGVTTSPSREDVTTTVGRPTASSSRDVHRLPCPPAVTARLG